MTDTTTDDAHATAIARFNASYSPNQGVRDMCQEAARFCWIPGAQYEGETVAGTKNCDLIKNRPKFEINKVRSEVTRIVNEYKNSRISAKFRPGNGDASDELAEKLNGKLQADAQDSRGTEARNNAFTEGVSSGFGCYRLGTTAEDEEDEEGPKRIIFEPIYDAARSVWFSANSKTQDKSDSDHDFVIYSMTPEAYKKEYNTDPVSMASASWGEGFDWYSPDVIYVAQYYERIQEPTTLITYQNPLTGHKATYDDRQIKDVEDELKSIGYFVVKRTKGKRWYVYCSVIDGEKILVNRVRLPGRYIPLIPVYGNRNYIDNIERITGHVQPSMDSQRLYNMVVSLIAEAAVNGTKQRPILYNEEVDGFEADWQNADKDDLSFVRLGKPAGVAEQATPYRPQVVGMTPLSQISPAIAELLNVSNSDISQTANAGMANQEVPGNVASETVSSFFGRSDMQSFGYLDNMSVAEQYAAKVWLSMAREVYGSERTVRINRPDGGDEVTTLSVQITDRQTGELIGMNDLSTGRYDVKIDVGPSFQTQRQATVTMLIELIKTTQTGSPYYTVLYAMLIQNIYAPGMEPLKEFNNKMMLQEGITPPKNQEEAQQVQQYQQAQQEAAANSPEAQITKSQVILAKAKVASSIADIIKAGAQAVDVHTDTWLKEAQAYSYVKNANTSQINSSISAFKALTGLAHQQTKHSAQNILGEFRP